MTRPPAPAPWWRRPAARLAGSAAVLALLFLALPVDAITGAIGRVPAWAWPAAVAGYLTLHLLGVAKWRLLVNAAGAGIPFRGAARAYYLGLFGSTFLPSIVGGDVVRAGVAFGAAQSRAGLVLGSLVDRLIDLLGLALVAGIGTLLSPRALDPASRTVFVWVAGGLAAAALGGLALLRFTPVRRLPWKARRALVKVRRALRVAGRRPGVLARALLLAMGLQTSLTVLAAWLGAQAGLAAPLYVWLFVWPLAKMSALVPVTQGGIGVREAAQAVLFAPFGVPAAMAVAAGLVFQVVVVTGGLVGGVLGWALGRAARLAAAAPGRAAPAPGVRP